MTPTKGSSLGLLGGVCRRYPGGTEYSSILRTVSRCNPNSRAASRMLIPSTITALRTRRYTSTLYIRCTTRRLDFEPMDGGGRYSIQSPNVSNLSAHVAHFNSADYIGVDPRAMGYGGVVSASLIVPNRVFIMDLSAADQQQGPEI